MTEADNVALSPIEVSLLAEYQQTARDIQQRAQGALLLILRQRHLDGEWALSPDGASLVRQ